MEGTGFLGGTPSEVYRVARRRPLPGRHLRGAAGRVPRRTRSSTADRLPLRYAGFSSCFRREAGSYGKDTRGIIRVHQFDKVEMFSFCPPEQSPEEHQRLLAWEKELLGRLELPYRVIDVAAGDLGASAARKFDCEAWMPDAGPVPRADVDVELHRLPGPPAGHPAPRRDGKPQPVHTLNGTLVAIPRTIVAMLENHQQPDGSVVVPKALRPYLGDRETLSPIG